MRAAQQLVTNAGQRIQIVAGIGGAAFQQLATCIGWSSRHLCTVGLPHIRLRADNVLRSAEIKNAKLAFARYHDVPWLQVAVDDTALVRVLQSCAQLPDDLPCLQWLHRCGAHAFYQIAQQLPIEEFHRKKNDISVPVQLEYVNDVPM
ncbi:MAG: hypothetical protein ABSG18_13570 [Steroidobacteraceae bacterium]